MIGYTQVVEYVPVTSPGDTKGTANSERGDEELSDGVTERTEPVKADEGGEEPAGNGWTQLAPFIGPRLPWGWASQNDKKRSGEKMWGKGYDPHNG